MPPFTIMLMKKFLPFIIILSILGFAFTSHYLFSRTSLAQGVLQTPYKQLDDLGRNLFLAIQTKDSISLAKLLPTSTEYISMEKHLADSTQNPNAGRFIALLMTRENYKSLKMWMSGNDTLLSLKNPWIEGPQIVTRKNGLEIWSGISLWAENEQNQKVQIPIIRSVVRSADGFKIYTLGNP